MPSNGATAVVPPTGETSTIKWVHDPSASPPQEGNNGKPLRRIASGVSSASETSPRCGLSPFAKAHNITAVASDQFDHVSSATLGSFDVRDASSPVCGAAASPLKPAGLPPNPFNIDGAFLARFVREFVTKYCHDADTPAIQEALLTFEANIWEQPPPMVCPSADTMAHSQRAAAIVKHVCSLARLMMMSVSRSGGARSASDDSSADNANVASLGASAFDLQQTMCPDDPHSLDETTVQSARMMPLSPSAPLFEHGLTRTASVGAPTSTNSSNGTLAARAPTVCGSPFRLARATTAEKRNSLFEQPRTNEPAITELLELHLDALRAIGELQSNLDAANARAAHLAKQNQQLQQQLQHIKQRAGIAAVQIGSKTHIVRTESRQAHTPCDADRSGSRRPRLGRRGSGGSAPPLSSHASMHNLVGSTGVPASGFVLESVPSQGGIFDDSSVTAPILRSVCASPGPGLRHLDSCAQLAPFDPQLTTEAIYEDDGGMSTINQYVLLAEIGAGAQGTVMHAVDMHTNETRAVKIVPRPKFDAGMSTLEHQRDVSALEREIAIMKKCRHRNIVSLYEVIDDPAHDALFLVMQYVENGSLRSVDPTGRCAPVKPQTLAWYARQLCAGLQYLHGRGVAHRDIKPENILLGDGDSVFLSDFGVSASKDGSTTPETSVNDTPGLKPQKVRGTVAFQPPEKMGDTLQYSTRDSKLRGEMKADVYMLGLSLYVMLYGHLPWPMHNAFQYMTAVRSDPIKFPTCVRTGSGLSGSTTPRDAAVTEPLQHAAEWKALLSSMLAANPDVRATAQDARACAKALCHLYETTPEDDDVSMLVSKSDLAAALTKRTGGGSRAATPVAA